MGNNANDESYDQLCFSFHGEETQRRSTEGGSKFTIKDVSKDYRRWIPPRVKCLHNECHIWTKEDQNRESHTLSINTSRQSENFVLTTLLNLIIGQLYQID